MLEGVIIALMLEHTHLSLLAACCQSCILIRLWGLDGIQYVGALKKKTNENLLLIKVQSRSIPGVNLPQLLYAIT